MITQEQLHKLFVYEDGKLVRRISVNNCTKVGDVAGCDNGHGYLSIGINGKNYRNNRIIFLMHHGYLPRVVDHINRDKKDNRIDNLRAATHSQNSANALRESGSSKYKGVCWVKSRSNWQADIGLDNKKVFIGRFKSEDMAALAYNKKAKELYGDFALLNKVG